MEVFAGSNAVSWGNVVQWWATGNPISLTLTTRAVPASSPRASTAPAPAEPNGTLAISSLSTAQAALVSGALATSATSSSNVGGYSITEGNLAATGNYTIGAFNSSSTKI